MEALLKVLPGGQIRVQGLLRVGPRHVQPGLTLAAHPGGQPDAAAELGFHGFLQRRLAGQRAGQHDLPGDRLVVALPQVILGQKGFQDFIAVFLAPGIRPETAVAEHPALAHHQYFHHRQSVAHRDRHRVHIAAPVGFHVLLLLHRLDGGELVAQFRGPLEIQLLGGFLHLLGEVVADLAAAAGEKIHRHAHLLGVRLAADEIHAGRGAALDLILQARPCAIAEEAVPAVAHAEHLFHQRQGFANAAGAGIGAEIAGAGPALAAMKGNARVLVRGGDLDIGVGLIVAQQNIVRRAQGLDQRLLKQQRLRLAGGDGGLHAGDTADQRPGFGAGDVFLEIGIQPGAQIPGFPHIEHSAIVVQHPVNTGLAGAMGEKLLGVELRQGHSGVGERQAA